MPSFRVETLFHIGFYYRERTDSREKKRLEKKGKKRKVLSV